MRSILLIFAIAALSAQDARQIVQKSVELDQANWLSMKNYTWTARQTERNLDSDGKVKSEKTESWETVILYGEAFHRMLERNGKPLSPEEQRKEQQKLDKQTAKLAEESDSEREKRLAKKEKEREKDREFLREIPDMFNFRIERSEVLEGRDVWVIAATPKPNYTPKRSGAKPLLKVKGELWIDKAEYQWVRLEAETVDTISFGLFLARLSPGSKLIFEQSRVNDEVWLPKREYVRASARLALLKKLSVEQEVTWSNFRKFSADSKIVAIE
jgi:hypothetical protein